MPSLRGAERRRSNPEGLIEDKPWRVLRLDCFAPLAMTAPLTSLRDAVDVEATPKAHRCVGCVYVEITHTKPNCTTNVLSQGNKPLNRVYAT
jgi:hypothetical protein